MLKYEYVYAIHRGGQPWIGLLVMDCTTGFTNGNLNVRIYWNVNLLCSQKQENAKKIVAWSGDFGLDQYISWNFSSEDLTLEVIWKKFEEFFKPK